MNPLKYLRWLVASRKARICADKCIQNGAARIASKPRHVKRRAHVAAAASHR